MKRLFSVPNLSSVSGGPLERASSLFDRQIFEALLGGKRLRAVLEVASSVCAGGPGGVEAACAIEIFQAGALVHDDIVDKSEVRRGKPSSRKAFFSSLSSPNFNFESADAMAIMLGDFLASASIEALLEAKMCPCPQAAVRAFCRMQMQVEKGQILDINSPSLPLKDFEGLEKALESIYLYKTASYTTIAPLALGFLEAGIEEEKAKKWAEGIGKPLGVAFQISDDLLDLRGGSKPKGSDIREKKRTFLLADALSLLSERERGNLINLYEKEDLAGREEEVAKVFEGCGAVEKSHERIKKLSSQAFSALERCCSELGLGKREKEFLARACSLFIPPEDLGFHAGSPFSSSFLSSPSSRSCLFLS
ncbi:MAG: polyprenyl synthetase family protein [Aeriscardovia sp.]|nr:polyprenyl synthetase family protein [Aeriscardovia sp.]